MPKIGEFCASNVARYLLVVIIALGLLAIVAYIFFNATGKQNLEKSPANKSSTVSWPLQNSSESSSLLSV